MSRTSTWTPAALLAAFMLAAVAVVLSATMARSAFAVEDWADEAEADGSPVVLATAELDSDDDSLADVAEGYEKLYDTKKWKEDSYAYKADKKTLVTIAEAVVAVEADDAIEGDASFEAVEDDAAAGFAGEVRCIQLVAQADVDADVVLVQVGDSYVAGEVPGGTLKEGTTYLVPLAQDAQVTRVALYLSHEDDDAAASDAGAADDDADAEAGLPAALFAAADDGGASDPADEGADGEGADGEGAAEGEGDDAAAGDDQAAEGDDAAAGDDQAAEGDDAQAGDDAATEAEDPAAEGLDAQAGDDTTDDAQAAAPAAPAVSAYAISIGKTDAKSNAMLAGAEFVLKDDAGATVFSWISSADGYQKVEGLRTDTSYVLSETKAPEGYNREKDINVRYDAASNKVLIDQGGASVALDNDSNGVAVLTVKDMQGSSPVQTSASTSPKTGDNPMLPVVVGVLAAVVVVAAVVAVVARKRGRSA